MTLKNRSDVIAFRGSGNSKRLLTNHIRISVLTLSYLHVICCIICVVLCCVLCSANETPQPFSTPTDAIEMNAKLHQPATDNST